MKTSINPSPVEDLKEHMLWIGFDQTNSVTKPLLSTTYFFDGIPIEIMYTENFGKALSRLNITSYQGRERELFTKMLEVVPRPGDSIEMYDFHITQIKNKRDKDALLISN